MFNSYFKLRLKIILIPAGFFQHCRSVNCYMSCKARKMNPNAHLLRGWFPCQPSTFVKGYVGCVTLQKVMRSNFYNSKVVFLLILQNCWTIIEYIFSNKATLGQSLDNFSFRKLWNRNYNTISAIIGIIIPSIAASYLALLWPVGVRYC